MIQRHKTRLITILFLFVVLSRFVLYSQEEFQFKAYGYTPNTIPESLYKSLNTSSGLNEQLTILYDIANAHRKNGNADSILYYAKRIKDALAIEDSGVNNTSIYTARANLLLGKGKYLNGFFEEATKAYIDGITVLDDLENTEENNQIKLGLGEVYLQQKEYDKAATLFSELISYRPKGDILAYANFYLGAIASESGNTAIAKEYYNKASAEIASAQDHKLNLWIQLNIGRLAAQENNSEKALSIFKGTMETALAKNYFDVYTEAVLEYGNVCAQLEEFQLAGIALSTAYVNAAQWDRLELQKKIINSLRLNYQASGDYKNAYNLMTQYTAISEQIIEQQNSKVLKEIEVKYQTLQKENQIYELEEEQRIKQSEIESQKTIKKSILYGFLILLIPIIILLFVYYQKLQTQSQLNKKQKELNAQKTSSLLQTQELALVRTSFDAQQQERQRIARQLHDSIGGNLAGIKLQLANLNESAAPQKDILQQVDETYELVREISHDLIPKKFAQNVFTFLIEEYINQLKKNSTLDITFSAHPREKINTLPEPFKVALYQIIQELFTNTLKHANANEVEVHLSIHDEIFQLLFEDDGNGFEAESSRKGIGLQNIESRLQQLEGILTLDSAPQRGTAITLEIPLKEDT